MDQLSDMRRKLDRAVNDRQASIEESNALNQELKTKNQDLIELKNKFESALETIDAKDVSIYYSDYLLLESI